MGTTAVLRPWQLSDAEAVVQAFEDPEIQRWHERRFTSADEAWQWITGYKAGWATEAELNWALADRTSDSLMGRLSLKSVDLHNGSAGVAYWMRPATAPNLILETIQPSHDELNQADSRRPELPKKRVAVTRA